MAATSSARSPELTLRIEKTPTVATVHCAGKITLYSAALLQDQVRPLIHAAKVIVLDLREVNQVDSCGMGAIVRLWMSSKKANCELRVANLSPRIGDLFTLANLSSIFENVEHSGK